MGKPSLQWCSSGKKKKKSHLKLAMSTQQMTYNLYSSGMKHMHAGKKKIWNYNTCEVLPQSYERESWQMGRQTGSISNSLFLLQKEESEVSPEA